MSAEVAAAVLLVAVPIAFNVAFFELGRAFDSEGELSVPILVGPEAVPEPRVVGGSGETPGDQRAHRESVLAHGTPPVPLLSRILLGEEGATG